MSMNFLLWGLLAIITIGTGYSTRWTEATLAFGRELAGSEEGTGFQDAITPPWQSNLALICYFGQIFILGIIWWQLGFGLFAAAFAAMFVGLLIVRAILPNAKSEHFRRAILHSMSSRYADYVRDGDTIRANAMKDLLAIAGIFPDDPAGT